MALISMNEAKNYLRVDSSDEDALIGILLVSAQQICVDVGRLSPAQWKVVDAYECDEDGNTLPTETDLYSETQLAEIRAIFQTAILFALGFLYEHREEADHKSLIMTLRSLLFAVREGVF